MRNIRRKAFTYVFADFLMLNIGWTVFSVVRYHFLPESIRMHYTLAEHLTQKHRADNCSIGDVGHILALGILQQDILQVSP